MIELQKNGYSATQVAQLIKALPASYLPDEQDLMLARTLKSIEVGELNDSEGRINQNDSLMSLPEIGGENKDSVTAFHE